MIINQYKNYSVLMSVYYKEKPEYLKQAIESIQQQTVPTNDFVLVCDGPLNSRLEMVIAQKQKEMGAILHIVRLAKNSGLGNALNEGLRYCKNELVARMDSDDISTAERCEKQVMAFRSDDTLSLLSGSVLEFVETPMKCMGLRKVPLSEREIKRFSKKRNPINHPCVMFLKSAVEKVGGYNEKFHLFEDYHLWIRMLQSGLKVKNISDILLYMRTSSDMYLRRGGWKYAKDMIRFHWWMYRCGWSNFWDFCTGAIPHAVVCVMPNKVRKKIYDMLRQ